MLIGMSLAINFHVAVDAVRTYTIFQSLTNLRGALLALCSRRVARCPSRRRECGNKRAASVGLVIFVPQIIKQLGVSNFETGLLTMIPEVVSTISMVVWGYVSDRI